MTRAEIIARLEAIELDLQQCGATIAVDQSRLDDARLNLDHLIDDLRAEEQATPRVQSYSLSENRRLAAQGAPFFPFVDDRKPRMMTEADLDDAMHQGIPGIMELIRSKEGKP